MSLHLKLGGHLPCIMLRVFINIGTNMKLKNLIGLVNAVPFKKISDFKDAEYQNR